MNFRWQTVVLIFMRRVCFLLFFVVFAVNLLAQESWQASLEVVENLSKARPAFNFLESTVPCYRLPDVLTAQNGREIKDKGQWEQIRRPELLEIFTSQLYGRVPNTAYQTTIKVVKIDTNALNGKATLKLIDITFSRNAKSLTIHLGLFSPNQVKRPVPAFLMICNRTPNENIDFSRVNKSEFWPVEEVIARGYAIAAFYNGDVDPDHFDNFQNGIHGLLDTSRTNESWGSLAAWAWGASRCLDYLLTDKMLAPEKIAVVGHSRGAKAALWAGATDQRFAMVFSNEAGCGGTALARRGYGETIAQINKSFPHWFCQNYKKYNDREDSLPVDMHQLMALIAPRALYVAAASDDLWGDPKGQYLALYHSLPIYQLYKKSNSLPIEMPVLNTPVCSGKVSYHIRDGEHNLKLKDWMFFMDFADRVFQ